MLDKSNTDTLCRIARNPDTPPNARVSACALVYRLSAMSAKELEAILQCIIDDNRTKDGVRVKALDLLDKATNSNNREPELPSEDVDSVKTDLMKEYMVCPSAQATAS